MNTVYDKNELLYQIAAYDFKVVDLNLYLDTHPYDMQAIMLFNEAKYNAMALRNIYECNYGPLTAGTNCPNYWNWLDSPWPWDRSC